MSDTQQKKLEETSKVALDAADAAARAAEEIHGVKQDYEKLLTSNRSILRGLSISLSSAAVGVVLAVGASALVYYKSRAQFEKSDEMLLQAVTVFAENVSELTLAQSNINTLMEAQTDLQNEIGLARKSLDTVPSDIDTKLNSILPQVTEKLDASIKVTEQSVSDTTELAVADLSQKLSSLIDEVKQITLKLNDGFTYESGGVTANSDVALEGKPNDAYAFVDVRSDLEQIILLQKELSAKITALQDAAKPKTTVVKRRSNPVKKTPKTPSNPLSFP